jgi:predicted phage terminase large subunit-like protein
MQRIVIGVDPAVTAGDSADETGIVICGKGADGFGYVLADLSCRMSPDGWARRVVQAYHDWHADRIVVEVNNGGDLVTSVLRTVDRNVPITKVHASKGKATRAEPVAALYEQGKVFHCGAFPELEDQMCNFVPGEYTGHDDRCFVAGTLITTLDGDKPIEEIKPGEYVLTRSGYQPVVRCGLTSKSTPILRLTLSCGTILECTKNHPVYVSERGFVEAWKLKNGDPLLVLVSKASGLTALNFGATRIAGARAPLAISTRLWMGSGRGTSALCTNTFGENSLVKSPSDMTFTTKTRISATTRLITLKPSQKRSTARGIREMTSNASARKWITLESLPLRGTAAKKALRGTKHMASARGKIASPLLLFVLSAAKVTRDCLKKRGNGFVQEPALAATMNRPASITKIEPVRSVAQSSMSRNPNRSRLVRASVVGLSDAGSAPVYNLTVANQPEYFANGVLVHNCDALVWALTNLMLKQQPRAAVSYQG